MKNTLQRIAKKNEIILNDVQVKKLLLFRQMLTTQGMNWSKEAFANIIVDCLQCYKANVFPQHAKVLDVASGFGFPGIPLKIVHEDMQLTLLDVSGKFLMWWKYLVNNLGIKNIAFEISMLENTESMKVLYGQYDIVLTRNLFYHNGLFYQQQDLIAFCMPFLKQGGRYIIFSMYRTRHQLINAKNSSQASGGIVEKIIECEIESRIYIYIYKIQEIPLDTSCLLVCNAKKQQWSRQI